MTFRYLWAKLLKKVRGAAVRNSTIDKTSRVESGSQVVNSTMGKHSFCGYNCQIANCDIGSFCSIAGGVVIGGGKHPMDWVAMSPVFYAGRDSVKSKFSEHEREEPLRTVIEHDVWIGENVLIKQGVTIGTGAVVGMGSVVTKDIPPYMVYAGNPACKIRERFSSELATELLKSEWWLFSEKRLLELGPLFTSPVEFLKAIKH